MKYHVANQNSITISGIERRTQERKILRVSGLLIHPREKPLQVRTMDISASGLGVISSVNHAVSTNGLIRLPLKLKPNRLLTFDVHVEVMHCIYSSKEDGFKVGLRFTHVPLDFAGAVIEIMND